MSIGTRDVESELIELVCERVRERVAPEEVADWIAIAPRDRLVVAYCS